MFVILDGPNGSGKTTIINNLKAKGIDTLSSPNGTDLASFLRPVCRGTPPWEDVDGAVQFLCFSAARLDEYIRRIKDNTNLIVADRWWTSTFVYQVCLEKFDIKFLEYTIHPQEKIDKVIIMTANPDVLRKRVETERTKNVTHGMCKWMRIPNVMETINKYYTDDLIKYLNTKNIPCFVIDTTNMDITQTQSSVEYIIYDT